MLLIITILVSLLSASLNHTKSRALRINCLDNEKQLQLAWTLYADENDDGLPLNKTGLGPLSHGLFNRRNSTNSWVAGNPREDLDTESIKQGTLFRYAKTPALYRCPGDRSSVAGHRDILRTRSYAMSAYLRGDNEGLDPRVKSKLSDIVSPEKIFVFLEEHEFSIWNSSFLVIPKDKFNLSSGMWSSTPADRHHQGCNLSFADGHVEYWRWFSPKKANLNNLVTTNPKELGDLRRLQAAVPK